MTGERVYLERGSGFVTLEQQGDAIERAFGQIDGTPRRRVVPTGAGEAAARLADEVRRLESKGYRPGRHHAELEAAIVAHPADPAPRLVFADWLIERHDPRGELITRMAAGVAVAGHIASFAYHLAPPWMARLELSWHLGYVRTIVVRNADDTALLQRALRHPSSMVVEKLRLPPLGATHVELVRFALQRRRPASLRRIDAPGSAALAALAQEIPGLET